MDSYKKEVSQSLISCIISSQDGVLLSELNRDFKDLTGYSIPYLSLGFPTLISYLSELKNIYFIKNEDNEDAVIADSAKSSYIKKLVEKQRPSNKRKRQSGGRESPDMDDTYDFMSTTLDTCNNSRSIDLNNNNKRMKKAAYINKQTMEKLSPILYGNQLLGDDILLRMAENHLMVNTTRTAPKRCGLCISGQTIQDLTDNIKQLQFIPSQVIILIGLTDILNDENIDDLIFDMQLLIYELKENNIKATICTIPKLSCVPKSYATTLKKFNQYILTTEIETNITTFNLETYYNWVVKYTTLSNKDKKCLFGDESFIILKGLQSHINLKNEE